MKYLICLVLVVLSCCTPSKDNSEQNDESSLEKSREAKNNIVDKCGNKQISLEYLSKVEFLSKGLESIDDSMLIERYFDFKKEFISFLDSNKKAVENSEIVRLNKKFLSRDCFVSIAKYAATDSLTFIYDSPIYHAYPPYNKSVVIDTVEIFDYVIVPLIDNEPFKVRNPNDFMSNFLNLCYYNGQFGFFINNSCIDSSKIERYIDNQYTMYRGNRIALRNNISEQYFIFPTNEVMWSEDNSKLVFMQYGELKDTNGYPIPQIYVFNLTNWGNSFLVYGKTPDFLNSKNSFIYFNTNKENWRKTNSINLYDFDTNTDNVLLQIPDSLDCGCWGPDLYHQSKVELSSWENQSCLSIKLYSSACDDPNVNEYVAYFNRSGDLLEIKLN